MPISKINSAVDELSREIASSYSQVEWINLEEKKLLYELFACILGSRVRYEISLAAIDLISIHGLLTQKIDGLSDDHYRSEIENVLKKPLHISNDKHRIVHYRFAHSRSKFLAKTYRAIYWNGSSLHQLLKSCQSGDEARKVLIAICTGIGPKQASLFLRNIGFSEDLAILDSHVMRFMRMNGLLDERIHAISSLLRYQEYEARLREFSHQFGWMLACVDQAIWIVMRVFQSEFAI